MKDNTAVCTKKRKPDEENDEESDTGLKNQKEKVWIENQTLFRKIVINRYEEVLKMHPQFGFKSKAKKLIDSESFTEEYKLKEISEEELYEVRTYGIPAFIWKENNRYFYTWIPFRFRLLGSMNVEHKCAPRNDVCKRLTPLPDNLGGCAKVRSLKPRIEKYAWITKGYETINTVCDCFIVLECEHHELESENGKLPKINLSMTHSTGLNLQENRFKFDTQAEESIFGNTDPFLDDVWRRLPKFFH